MRGVSGRVDELPLDMNNKLCRATRPELVFVCVVAQSPRETGGATTPLSQAPTRVPNQRAARWSMPSNGKLSTFRVPPKIRQAMVDSSPSSVGLGRKWGRHEVGGRVRPRGRPTTPKRATVGGTCTLFSLSSLPVPLVLLSLLFLSTWSWPTTLPGRLEHGGRRRKWRLG